ncbi:hypothetical protein EA004_15655 [Vibrio anguillarum]|uniref:SMODS and SLOG-associating 2TM effector domain-containing protein n=8 Tax=Vibrio anguillarum TaxID=55601 RepID=A0AAW4BND5_VIBAN|nr:hypothetical protein [Vibrio anguillarum]EJC6746699.1 hypothetical protein [Vibrio vulnificus]ASG09089.1 hypothetical protein CEQ50_16145 [Vibrio anguillarum]EJC6821934.1 hypothetical protein [Vibrio vulnificus]EJC6955636.1 hypothetical protein [Vibrio vulnificus]EJC6960204.1 hypothetical protein [Vibrio vulnificus]
MSDEIRREFIVRIEDLRVHISNRYNVLNLEAIWLFVATLGCWSVNQPIIQLMAILLVFVFFSSKIFKDKKYESTFTQHLKEIRADIEASVLEGDVEKARLHELDEIEKNLLSIRSIYKSTPMFLLGYGFWALSLFTFGYRMFFVTVA